MTTTTTTTTTTATTTADEVAPNDRLIAQLLSAYRAAAERMRELRVANPRLTVEAIGFRRDGAALWGIVITPWFMSFVVLGDEAPRRDGEKRNLVLPSGIYEAIGTILDGVGPVWSVPLLSPMNDVADVDAARAAAEAALAALLSAPAARAASAPEPAAPSRRELFARLLGRRS